MSCGGRIALLAPYWDFFEANVPFDLRADRTALLDDVAALLAPDVCCAELADGEASGVAAAERVRAARAEALVVVMAMCVPPAYALAALDALPELPLVVAVVSRSDDLGGGLTHARIAAEGATVGGPQLTNVLHRRGRLHALVVGTPGAALGADLRTALAAARSGAAGIVPASPPGPAPAPPGPAPAPPPPAPAGPHRPAPRPPSPADEQRAAHAAVRLRAARIARVGRPIPGYDCVDCDDDALRAATGIELVDVAPATVQAAYRAADPERVAAIEAETRATFALAGDVEAGETLARSVRFAAAVEALDDELGVDAGAMNCHVPELRFAPDEPGITPCYALGRETTRGIPWSCAGDVVTAVALLSVKLLGGAALYHEIEALDHDSGEALLANSGEHDLAFADPAVRPMLQRNRWWASDPRCGACACFGPAPGPATLVAFTPHHAEPSGFRYVVAEGAFGARRLPETGTPNAAFRFAGGEDVTRAWARWVGGGVNHHSVATPGRLGGAVAALAARVGVGCVRVS